MADETTEQEDKTEEPSQRKLDEARAQGDVIRSQDVGSFFVLAASAVVVLTMIGPMSLNLSGVMAAFLERPHEMSVDGAGLQRLGWDVMGRVGLACAAAFGLLALAGLVGNLVQDRPVFTAKRIQPSLDKISPMKGFNRLFGGEALLQFAKNLLKLVLVGGALGIVLWPRIGELAVWPTMPVAAWGPAVLEIVRDLFIAALIAVGLIAGLDYTLARQAFMKRQRMTREEMKQEFKDTEGNPEVKAKLRQIRMSRSRNRMLANVPNATVVITNPTHYSVALRYVPGETAAPVCVAKGVDDVALRIREVAGEANVPIMEDPPLARALFATAEIDQPIPKAHWEAAAKIIGVVLKLAAKPTAGLRGRTQ
jgi:flagellar biosynthesis protein FlhB